MVVATARELHAAGEWKADKKDGQGVYRFKEGDGYSEYDGEWVAGKQEGRGEHTLANDDVYDGQWRNGTKHGRGTYYYALRAEWPAPRPGCVDGAVFEGEFADGDREGAGTHWHTDGSAEVASYVAGAAHYGCLCRARSSPAATDPSLSDGAQ